MSRGKFGQEIFVNSWIAWSLLQPRPNILRPRVSPLKLELLSVFTKETSQKLQKYHPNLDFENSTVVWSTRIENAENFIEKVLVAKKFIDAINLIVYYNNKVIVYQTGTCKFAAKTYKIPSFFSKSSRIGF